MGTRRGTGTYQLEARERRRRSQLEHQTEERQESRTDNLFSRRHWWKNWTQSTPLDRHIFLLILIRVLIQLDTFLQTINLSLSAPELPKSALQSSKAYLFLLQNESQSHREHIVGCVIAQRITTAMAIIPPSSPPDCSNTTIPIIVDSATNLSCSPTPLRTPMGISRLFVSSSHRRLGIAHSLLGAAAATFIHGCPLDPHKGQVAFSQPTGMGQAVMTRWGCTRVYEE